MSLLCCHAAGDSATARGCIFYTTRSGYHLLRENQRHFALSIDERVHLSRPSVDILFISIAEVYGEMAIGVILSGVSDG